MNRHRAISLILLCTVFLLSGNGRALTRIDVDTPDDVVDAGDGLTSLREAIDQANASGDDVEIVMTNHVDLTLDVPRDNANVSGDLDITKSAGTLTLRREGSTVARVRMMGQHDRCFHILGGCDVVFQDFSIANGFAHDDGTTVTSARGGGILLEAGRLTLTGMTLGGNYATAGDGENGIFGTDGIQGANGTNGASGADGHAYTTGEPYTTAGSSAAFGGDAPEANEADGTTGGDGGIGLNAFGGAVAVTGGELIVLKTGFASNFAIGGDGGNGGRGGEAANGGSGGGGGEGGEGGNGNHNTDTNQTISAGGNAGDGGWGRTGATGGAGGVGGHGGNGGDGRGGAIALLDGTLVMGEDCAFSQNEAIGGNGGEGGWGEEGGEGGRGGNGGYGGAGGQGCWRWLPDLDAMDGGKGGDGGHGGDGGEGGRGGHGGDAGRGGDGMGGALYAVKSFTCTGTVEHVVTFAGNKARGGIGGLGGQSAAGGKGGMGGASGNGGVGGEGGLAWYAQAGKGGKGGMGGRPGQAGDGGQGGTPGLAGIGGTGRGGAVYVKTATETTILNLVEFSADQALGGTGGNGGVSAPGGQGGTGGEAGAGANGGNGGSCYNNTGINGTRSGGAGYGGDGGSVYPGAPGAPGGPSANGGEGGNGGDAKGGALYIDGNVQFDQATVTDTQAIGGTGGTGGQSWAALGGYGGRGGHAGFGGNAGERVWTPNVTPEPSQGGPGKFEYGGTGGNGGAGGPAARGGSGGAGGVAAGGGVYWHDGPAPTGVASIRGTIARGGQGGEGGETRGGQGGTAGKGGNAYGANGGAGGGGGARGTGAHPAGYAGDSGGPSVYNSTRKCSSGAGGDGGDGSDCREGGNGGLGGAGNGGGAYSLVSGGNVVLALQGGVAPGAAGEKGAGRAPNGAEGLPGLPGATTFPRTNLGGSRISGEAWRDDNGDGIRTGGETGSVDGDILLDDGTEHFPVRARLGAFSEYLFLISRPGKYRLQYATSQPFAPTVAPSPKHAGRDPSVDSDFDPASWATDWLNLDATSGDWTYLDAGLSTAKYISGTIYCDNDNSHTISFPSVYPDFPAGDTMAYLDLNRNARQDDFEPYSQSDFAGLYYLGCGSGTQAARVAPLPGFTGGGETVFTMPAAAPNLDDVDILVLKGTPEYTVTFDPTPHGEIASGNAVQQIEEGGDAVEPTIAILHPAWVFDGWDKAFNNVTRHLTVTARYVYDPTDTDHDGVSDTFETQFFDSPAGCDPDGDPDHDGSSNAHEARAGTNPHISGSVFVISDFVIVSQPDGTLTTTMGWVASMGRRYTVRRSTDMRSWTSVTSGRAASPPRNEVTFESEADGSHQYFSVTVE